MDLSPELSVSAKTVCSIRWKNIAPGVRKTCQPALGMEEHPKFELAQARELAEAFAVEEIEYLFLGKAGAILLVYPGTTMDVDIFAPIKKRPVAGNFTAELLREPGCPSLRHPSEIDSRNQIRKNKLVCSQPFSRSSNQAWRSSIESKSSKSRQSVSVAV